MKGKSAIILCVILAIGIGLGFLSYFGIGANHFLGYQGIKQGLDLKGGVRIVYEADKEDPTREEMGSALSMIRDRLDRKNYTEGEVAIQGTKRLSVEIPDIEDAEVAVSDIGKTAQLLFADEEGNILLTGDHVKNAYKSVNSTTQGGAVEPVVALEFDSEGQQLFEEATGNNIGKAIIIMLDDSVLSAPTVNSRIAGGNAVISGNFTPESAEELAALIRAGSLPFNLTILSVNNIGAKLGANSLESSLLAGVIGFVLIILFMLFIYQVAGLAADIALCVYIGLVLVSLSLLGVTLTLPGIAGIILSVGMAVDANIIMFERLREELNAGRTIRSALDAGFHRALPPIIDANITTLIAAAVLFWLGTGPIKGFAQTLAIGVVLSMITAIMVTRYLLKSFIGLGIANPKLYGAK